MGDQRARRVGATQRRAAPTRAHRIHQDVAPRHIGGHAQIALIAEVIGANQRGDAGIGRGDCDAATAVRAQVAYRGGEGRKVVQWLTETLQRERLDVVLQVGARLVDRVAVQRAADQLAHRMHLPMQPAAVVEQLADVVQQQVEQAQQQFLLFLPAIAAHADLVGQLAQAQFQALLPMAVPGMVLGIGSILFFLLGAMTIVELIDSHSGFSIIKRMSSRQWCMNKF